MEKTKSNSLLPSIKQSNSQQRFSSWNTSNDTHQPQKPTLDRHLSELDELLLENDELLNSASPDPHKFQIGQGISPA